MFSVPLKSQVSKHQKIYLQYDKVPGDILCQICSVKRDPFETKEHTKEMKTADWVLLCLPMCSFGLCYAAQ